MPDSDAWLEHKNAGNEFFRRQEYPGAIIEYSKAIPLKSSEPTLFTNRAICHLKLGHWQDVVLDSQSALNLDSKNVKACYFLGKANLQAGGYADSLAWFEKAFNYSKEKPTTSSQFNEELFDGIYTCKKRQWEANHREQNERIRGLRQKLKRLLEEDASRGGTDVEALNEELTTVELSFMEDAGSKEVEVPEIFMCKISFEIMRDPVLTPSGQSYDRSSVTEHLRKVGQFDPVTRTPLLEKQLYPNRALKEALIAWLDEHPCGWPY